MTKADIYRRERQNGLSYQQIADKYGVSKQLVYRACSKNSVHLFRNWTKDRCIYVNIRNWLNDNKVTKSELLRRLGLEVIPSSHERVNAYLKGVCYPQKKTIDKFIEVTGLTYAELWVIG